MIFQFLWIYEETGTHIIHPRIHVTLFMVEVVSASFCIAI